MPTLQKISVATSGHDLGGYDPKSPPPSAAEAQQLIQDHQLAIAALKKYLDALKGIESLKSQNGHRSGRAVPRVPNPVTKPGAPTGLKRAVRDLAPKLAQPFTLRDILENLHGIKFKGDPKAAVRDAINELRKQKVFKVVEHGKGSNPNKYQVG